MSVRILQKGAAAVVLAGVVLVSGCGGSNPLEIVTDTDQTDTDQAGVDQAGTDQGTEEGSSGVADSGDADAGSGSVDDTGSDVAGTGETDSGTTGEADAGNTGETDTEASGGDSTDTDSDSTTDEANTGEVVTDESTTDEAATDEAATDNAPVDNGVDEVSPPAAAFEAMYRATFTATWSVDTHPVNFPDNPHFSPLTGAVHSEQAIFWESGQNATDGIEQMAETGATAILLTEVNAVIDEGRALSAIQGGGIPESPGSTSVEFTVNRDYPLVTLVSMLAPSPDWFIGVNSLQMIDENGDFRQSITIDLNLYDSGTDGGTRYTSADEDIPRSPIGMVNSFPLDSDFQEGQPTVGRLTLELIP